MFKISLFISLVILLWASAFVTIGHLVTTLDPILIAFGRNVVASFFFSFFLFNALKKNFNQMMQSFKIVFFLGLFGVFAYNILLNYGQIYIEPATASFLVNLVPGFTLIGSGILGWEKITFLKVFSIIVCFLGATIISLSKGLHMGDWTFASLLVIGAAISQAIYFLIVKHASHTLSPLVITMGAILIGSGLLLPFSYEKFFLHSFNIEEVILLVYLGIGPSWLAFLMWSHVLKESEPGMVSLFLLLVPIVAYLMNYFIFSETPSTKTLLGCVVVLLGLLILKYRELSFLIKNAFTSFIKRKKLP